MIFNKQLRTDNALSHDIRILSKRVVKWLEVAHEVKGVSGTYTVTIGQLPCCTCPDWDNSHCCKHMIYVLHHEYKIPVTAPLIGKAQYTRAEVAYIAERERFTLSTHKVHKDIRVTLALQQPMYVWSTTRVSQLSVQHGVETLTGHRMVTVAQTPSCTCATFTTDSIICEHLIHVLVIRHRVDASSPLVGKRSYTDEDLRLLAAKCPADVGPLPVRTYNAPLSATKYTPLQLSIRMPIGSYIVHGILNDKSDVTFVEQALVDATGYTQPVTDDAKLLTRKIELTRMGLLDLRTAQIPLRFATGTLYINAIVWTKLIAPVLLGRDVWRNWQDHADNDYVDIPDDLGVKHRMPLIKRNLP